MFFLETKQLWSYRIGGKGIEYKRPTMKVTCQNPPIKDLEFTRTRDIHQNLRARSFDTFPFTNQCLILKVTSLV